VAETQVDLFLDQLVDAPFKDERNLMEFPFFSLEKRPRKAPFVYDDGKVSIRIEPSSKGMATIWDKDLLIYLTSIINDRLEKTLPVDPVVRFAAHDFLKATGRSSSSRGYDLLLDALYRLRNTSILTNIKAGGDAERRNFGWISEWKVIERVGRGGIKRMAGVEVSLSRWMFDAIVKDRRVLTIASGYFELSQGIERRLYELARKNCARGKEWSVPLSRLAERCGSLREARKFKADLKAIAAKGGVLDYRLNIDEREDGAWAVIFPKPMAIETERQSEAEILAPPHSDLSAFGQSALTASARAYEKARRLAPGWDIANIEILWRAWSENKGTVVENPDAAFLAFVRTHVAANATSRTGDNA